MKSNAITVYRKDYLPPPYRIQHTRMEFDLDYEHTRVRTTHHVVQQRENPGPLILDLEEIEIESLLIDEQKPKQGAVSVEANQLQISSLPASCQVELVHTLNPLKNSKLEGLYHSGSILCTQCEAEGFRRITPSIDRPDNLTTYQVLLRGNRETFPVLLCNGNLVRQEIRNGIHETEWYDPFPKPTYLFAIVAGHLDCWKESFMTASGRKVSLHFYAAKQDIEKCKFAIGALQRAMRWDEENFGREYDLDLYNIVAVKDFNMGAMENRSLNIFNIKYVLADPDVSTDQDMENVERVIGHEYFHNWSGNRVTCRDWFQLSLKEGFTVFREQSFCADMGSAGVQRIDEVDRLRNYQFTEDAGPLAHSVRPDSYQEINNFYTVTVYEKGAEVVRMLQVLVGEAAFRRGTDIYFDRHDGQAVTTDDFVAAIQDGAEKDTEFEFVAFKRWYSQAGTPIVHMDDEYDPVKARYILTLRQHCPATPGQSEKLPFVIPVLIALLDSDGHLLSFADGSFEQRLILSAPKQQFVFDHIPRKPIPSLFRRFSAPVKLETNLGPDELSVLFQYDSDPFNRWDAGQRLFQKAIFENLSKTQLDEAGQFDDEIIQMVGNLIQTPGDDLKLISRLLTLPDASWLGELSKPSDPVRIAASRRALMQRIATVIYSTFMDRYRFLQSENEVDLGGDLSGHRALRDICLEWLSALDTEEVHHLARIQLATARNLTDRSSALKAIANSTMPDREKLLDDFYQAWKNEPLVIDRWLRIQATAHQTDVLEHVRSLTIHPCFDSGNPNKIYALLLGFAMFNPFGFHRVDGNGYEFIADWVLKLDSANPLVAARLVGPLVSWRDLIPKFGTPMKSALTHIRDTVSLSSDVSEIVSRALDSDS